MYHRGVPTKLQSRCILWSFARWIPDDSRRNLMRSAQIAIKPILVNSHPEPDFWHIYSENIKSDISTYLSWVSGKTSTPLFMRARLQHLQVHRVPQMIVLHSREQWRRQHSTLFISCIRASASASAFPGKASWAQLATMPQLIHLNAMIFWNCWLLVPVRLFFCRLTNLSPF